MQPRIEPWQQDILNKMAQFKGRGLIQITGRNAGKSTLSSSAFQRLWQDIQARPIERLVLSEGKVFGARYYTIEPVGGSWPEMEEWCLDMFGSPGSVWDQTKNFDAECKRWYMNDRKFWFRNVKDRDWFVIRWNS